MQYAAGTSVPVDRSKAGWDVPTAILDKHEFNKGRECKHGKAF